MEQFGQILYFLLIGNLPFAVLQPFGLHTSATDHFNLPQPDCTPLNSKLFIVPQESDNNYVAVPVNHTISKVFLLILVPITVMLFAFQPILQLTSLYFIIMHC